MSALGRVLNKPHYVFRPGQVLRRMVRGFGPAPDEATVELPWGGGLRIHPREVIGRALWTTGVYDLPVTEALWRLIDGGETAVDVGANIGYFTTLMARRVGPAGRVLAAEPHPDLFLELSANVARQGVTLFEGAIGDRPGRAALVEPGEFTANRGTAHLATAAVEAGRRVEVSVTTLDAWCGGRSVGALKLDVEGHELAVLQGAETLTAAGAIRDVVYEDLEATRSGVRAHLEGLGFTVFALCQRLLGPALLPPDHPLPASYAPPSYLATRAPERARARFARRGWACLS